MTMTFRIGSVAALSLALVAGPRVVTAQTQPHDDVTFTKDIAPILQRSCQKCHRPNSLAPMSLITYE